MNRYTYDPKSKGRFYQVFIESDAGTAKITSKDIDGFTLGNAEVVCPEGFHVTDYKLDIDSVAHSSSTEFWKGMTIGTDGKQAVHIPDADAYDYLHLWIFGYFD